MKRKIALIFILLAVLAAVALWYSGLAALVDWREVVNDVVAFVKRSGPVAAWACMAFLPLVGFPISPIWIAAGAAFGTKLGLLLAGLGILTNLSLAHLISNRLLRSFLLKFLRRRGYVLPDAEKKDLLKLTLAFRITPGIPLAVQNYLLGLANVPFSMYVFATFPIHFAYAVAFIVLGGSLFSMKGGGIIAAVCILVGLTLIVSVVRHYFNINQFSFKKPSLPANGEEVASNTPRN